jgi:hypothetical protein
VKKAIQVVGFLALAVLFIQKAPDWVVLGVLILAMFPDRNKARDKLKEDER